MLCSVQQHERQVNNHRTAGRRAAAARWLAAWLVLTGVGWLFAGNQGVRTGLVLAVARGSAILLGAFAARHWFSGPFRPDDRSAARPVAARRGSTGAGPALRRVQQLPPASGAQPPAAFDFETAAGQIGDARPAEEGAPAGNAWGGTTVVRGVSDADMPSVVLPAPLHDGTPVEPST